MSYGSRLLLPLLCVWSLPAIGCQSSQPLAVPVPSAAVSTAPHNLTIDVTVAVGRERSADIRRQWADGRALPKSWRPSRYVLQPDGTLHYATDDSPLMWKTITPATLPPVRNVLGDAQRAELWNLIAAKGMGDPDQSAGSINLELAEVPTDEIVHLIAITAGDRRWCFVRSVQQESSADTTALVNMLSDCAWADRRAPIETVVMPRRYDFGPDPYARYRTQSPSTAQPVSTGDGGR